MIFIKYFAISIMIFVILLVGSRYFDIYYAQMDWGILILCSLLPLFNENIRSKKVVAFAFVVFLAAILFFVTFFVMAYFYGEGL